MKIPPRTEARLDELPTDLAAATRAQLARARGSTPDELRRLAGLLGLSRVETPGRPTHETPNRDTA